SYRRIRLRGSRIRRTTALPEPYQLSSLPVGCVLPAAGAEPRRLDPVRIVLPVLRRRVPARPAGRARERDDRSVVLWHLGEHLRYHARADGVPAFTDREPESIFECDRSPERDFEIDVITRDDHLAALGQLHVAGDVRGPDIELRSVAVEERRVSATFLLGKDVDLGVELGVGLHRPGLRDDLTPLDVLALEAAEQQPDVVPRLGLVEQLLEHLDAGDDRLLRLADADDLDFVADLRDAALDATCGDRAATLDREDVLDRHQERLVLDADG